MNREEVERLLLTLHERDGRWRAPEDDAVRWTRRLDSWAAGLAPCRTEDVKVAVDFARRAGRIEMITPTWLLAQCQTRARSRAAEAATPRVECEDCRALGHLQLCERHVRIGRDAIAAIRAQRGWPTPAEQAAREAADIRYEPRSQP